eukprot:Skav211865  [mRNA]  locus=scaffold1431:140532:142989:- [translate_table: standard]
MAGGYERAAWALISAGADISAKDNNDITPLLEGLLKLRVNPSSESIARAVSTVAQLCDKSEFETLHDKLEAGCQSQYSAVGHVSHWLRLVGADWADPNSRDANGESVVHAALTLGNEDLMRKREFRGDPEATATEGIHALQVAAMRGHMTAAKTLLDAGAAVGSTDDSGSTALHAAASHGQAEMVSVLLSRRASVEATTADGTSVKRWAPLRWPWHFGRWLVWLRSGRREDGGELLGAQSSKARLEAPERFLRQRHLPLRPERPPRCLALLRQNGAQHARTDQF